MNFFRMIKMDFKKNVFIRKILFCHRRCDTGYCVEHQSGSNAEPVECIGILPGCQQPWCGCIF